MFRATTAALVGVAAGTINLAIEDCGDASTHGHVAGISPSAISQGHKTVVSGSGHLDTTVADGSFEVKVKAAGVALQHCKGDLCSASKCALPAGTGHVDFRGAACPLQAGDITLDFDVQVSRFVPSSLAHLDIEIESEGSAGKLLCAKIKTSPGLSSEAECVAPNFNFVSQSIEGVVKARTALYPTHTPFTEKVDMEKFNVHGESTTKIPMGKVTQKHILSIEKRRFALLVETKGMLIGHHRVCRKMDLPAKVPDVEKFAELYQQFSASMECKGSDGAMDTWRFSDSAHPKVDLETVVSPDGLLHEAIDKFHFGPIPVHADVVVKTAEFGGPEEADLDEAQFGDCKEIGDMPMESIDDLIADSPGFFTRNILALVQQIPESVVV